MATGFRDFDRRMKYLSEQVGTGWIRAGVIVDQIYAKNQHENTSFEHNTGGRVYYLRDPLMENAFNLVDGMARAVITPEGSRIKDEMRDIAEDLSDYVYHNAPRDPDIGDILANSGSPYVEENGERVYHRPPVEERRKGPSESGWKERPPKKRRIK
jgi:hypothetical protein